MNVTKEGLLSKVPEVTLTFWIIKILATTLGETGGDAVSMSMGLGYLVGTGIFAVIFIIAVIAQISAKRFSSFALLDNHYRDDNGWNDISRLCRSLAWYRLCGRNNDFVRAAYSVTIHLVSSNGFSSRRYRELAEIRNVLLGNHYVFPDPRHGAWRLDS